MLVEDLPFTKKIAEKYPGLYKSPLSRALYVTAKHLFDRKLKQFLKDEAKINAEFLEQIRRTDLTGKKIIQIGANDGKHDDPLASVLEDDVEAILVEPLAAPFKELSHLYGERPSIHLVQRAISRNGGLISLHTPVVPNREMRGTGLTSTDKAQVFKAIKINMGRKALKQSRVISNIVHTQAAGEFLEVNDVAPEEVAVLVCDTEGQDAEIINSFLEAGVRPEVIFYEQVHVAENLTLALKQYLEELGYHISENKKDVLATLHPSAS
jgi:FkbM family methyltransferase